MEGKYLMRILQQMLKMFGIYQKEVLPECKNLLRQKQEVI